MARIGLTQLPRKAQTHVHDRFGVLVDAPSYRRGFDGAVSNKFPAEFHNGRWTVDEADLDKIVIALGMVDRNAPASDPKVAVTRRAAA